MVTLISEQQSDEKFEEAYSRLLGPFPPMPPDKNSDPQLQTHESCKLWLTNLIRLLDTEISPHIIIYNNLIRIQENLLQNIQTHLDNTNVPATLFRDKDTVLRNFDQVILKLALATDARETIPGKPTIEQLRGKNVCYYDFLMECTEWLEKVLQFWNREDLSADEEEARPDPKIKKILDEQRSNFNNITEFFRKTVLNKIQPPSVEQYEGDLRAIIAQLSHGSEPEISDKQANHFIQSKEVLIQELRKTKKLFNLILDEFALCEQEGASKEQLFGYLVKCRNPLKSWSEKSRSN